MIYLDYAATAPMRASARRAMAEAMERVWGNASALYRAAAEASDLLEESREILARSIGAEPGEIYFTSGGTEGDNWALTGAVEASGLADAHVIVSEIEHHAVLHTCDYLESRGFSVTRLPVDEEGRVNPADVEAAITPSTVLVSVMAANNEIGTIEPIEEIGEICRAHQVLFHTDAVQACGHLPLDVSRIHADLLSTSAHKLGGPKGIGFLYIREGTRIGALLHGGAQERGRRAGTANVPAAAGFAAAAREALAVQEEEAARERELTALLFSLLQENIPETILNGPAIGEWRLPGNLSVSFPGLSAETLLIWLDLQGIAASAGSACTTGVLDPSHVIMAISGDERRARGTLRFTLGEGTSEQNVRSCAEALARKVRELYDRHR